MERQHFLWPRVIGVAFTGVCFFAQALAQGQTTSPSTSQQAFVAKGAAVIQNVAADPVVQASEALWTWRRDWENRSFERFAEHYAQGFQIGSVDRDGFLEKKRLVFEKRPWHRVRIADVLWVADAANPDRLTVRFIQEYETPQGADRSRKEQRWVRIDTRWRILNEREEIVPDALEVPAARKAAPAKQPGAARY
jgi:hypothetical protein